MPYPIEYIFELTKTWNWALIAIVAGAVGAIAATWDRLMGLIDQWILKTVHSGHRGTLWVLGNAVRFPTFKFVTKHPSWTRLPCFISWEQPQGPVARWSLRRLPIRYSGMWLFFLPPLTYLQVFLLVQVRDFSIQPRPLVISPQMITNKITGEVLRVEGNATIRNVKGGKYANISQVEVADADGIAHMRIQKVIAEVIANAWPVLISNPDEFNKAVFEKCGFLPGVCGLEVLEMCLATIAPNEGQQQKDGMIAIAKSVTL